MTDAMRLVLDVVRASPDGVTEYELRRTPLLARKVKAQDRARLAQQMTRMGVLQQTRIDHGDIGGRPRLVWRAAA